MIIVFKLIVYTSFPFDPWSNKSLLNYVHKYITFAEHVQISRQCLSLLYENGGQVQSYSRAHTSQQVYSWSHTQ